MSLSLLSKYQYNPNNITNAISTTNNSFNNNPVNSYNNTEDNSNGIFIYKKTPGGTIYLFLNIFCILYFLIPLIWICFYRNWYVIKQRNFTLTFIGGIATFINNFFNLITQVAKVPCAFSYYSATVFNFLMQLCFISRAIRLIFLYRLNVYKVTELSQDKFIQKSKNGQIVEPNIYYKSIYKMVDKKIVRTLIPALVLIYTVICVVFHLTTKNGTSCGLIPVDINEKLKGDGTSHYNNMRVMFELPQITGSIFSVINILIALKFTFSDIRDDQRFGIKFDCFSNSVISIIARVIYTIMSYKFRKIVENNSFSENQGFLKFYAITKNGLIFFIFIGFYIHTTSIIIPLYKCIKAERMNKRYINEPTNTMEYFYKILNSPNLLEELKTIAIQEFSVENILFWENYCILRKYAIRISKKQNCNTSFSNYKYDEINNSYYCLQDTYSHSSSSQDDANYNPSFPLVSQLKPYYNSFYNTFIDINGPASVNITGNTMRRIYHGFYTYPTVGIFDEAKDEVVESMYFSLFPILLQQNWKQLGEIR